LAILTGIFVCSNSVSGIAKQSTLSLSTSAHTLPMTILPSATGEFGKTDNNTITISTDNFSGYSLMIASDESTNIENANHDAITSISSAISEATFSTDTTYNNKWGYKPSQYVTTNGGVNTTVLNTDYLPAPSLTGDLISLTNQPL
jgi:hypothetical protein